MSSRNMMLLVTSRGGPGSSCCSRERRGVISQKKPKFHSEAQQISRSLNQHFRRTEFARKPHTSQDKPYPLAVSATYDEWQAQHAAGLQLECDGCLSRVCYPLLPAALAAQKQIIACDNERSTRHSSFNLSTAVRDKMINQSNLAE